MSEILVNNKGEVALLALPMSHRASAFSLGETSLVLQDESGKRWHYPITPVLRDKIEPSRQMLVMEGTLSQIVRETVIQRMD